MVYTEEQLAEKIAKLPKYTVREEQANVITHFIGMIIGIIGLLIMFSFAIVRTIRDINNFVDIISSLVFGGSMVALYTMSTVYHNEKNLKKRVFRQKFDHLSINILIAGSCSAFMISGLKNNIGYILISCVWALSILSMVLNWINVKKIQSGNNGNLYFDRLGTYYCSQLCNCNLWYRLFCFGACGRIVLYYRADFLRYQKGVYAQHLAYICANWKYFTYCWCVHICLHNLKHFNG